MKKIILILALAFILVSCGGPENAGENDNNADNISDNAGAQVQEEESDPRDIPDGVPELDFGGADFRIIYRDDCVRSNWNLYDVHQIEIWTEELNGDVINDALFERNRAVEERLNVNIAGLSGRRESELTSFVRRSIASSSDDFDFIVGRSNELASLAADGLFINWNGVPYIDTDMPWWIKDAMDEFTIRGRTFMAMSDLIFPGVIGEAAFIMFNHSLLADFGLENPYAMVESNNWTIDILNNIVRACYIDVNGDTLRDVDDIYGFTSDAWGSAYAWMWAGGNRVTSKDGQGIPYYDMYTERNAVLLEKVNDLFYNNDGSAITNARGNSIDFKGRGDQSYLFSEGNALFMLDRVGVLLTPDYRNAPFEFGILPIPKFDTAQEKYLTMINEHASVMAIPAYNANLEMSGAVIEVLSAESHKKLVPAYYEVSLKTKYSRDEESVRMLDLIFEGVVYDFGLLYAIQTFDIYQTILCNEADPGTFASQIERNQARAETALQRVLDLYDEID
ncbi:MAG: hypothetical protein FWH24_00680 [Oscillospiraceae bacterium]|nr:hypothetical protein [Oscillospiraceae bacterium]